MWKVIVCAATVVVLAACGTTDDCSGLHQVLAPSSGSDPGTLQLGFLQSTSDYSTSPMQSLAARSDGSLVCVTCIGMVMLDAGLHEQGRVDAYYTGTFIAVGPDDSIYAVLRDESNATELVAMSAAREPRWKAPIIPASSNAVPSVDRLVVGAEGPYIGGALDAGRVILGFDAAGTPRTVATGQDLLGLAHDGVFTVESQSGGSLTLHRLDSVGNVVWSHPVSAVDAAGNATIFQIGGAVATADDGVIVFGTSESNVDFGDRMLAIPSGGFNGFSSFVAGFDAVGATQWAFVQPDYLVSGIALTAQGEMLIVGGRPYGLGYYSDVFGSAYLSVATPAGVTRTLSVTGPGEHSIDGIATTSDGLAWVQVGNFRLEDHGDNVMKIGDHTFTDEGVYLFKLVP
jgi:hypothetical protein